MKKINRLERYQEASTEIRTALLLATEMLSRMEVARHTYTSRQKAAARESFDSGTDVIAAIRKAQRSLRPMAFCKTAEERKAAERAARRRQERRAR